MRAGWSIVESPFRSASAMAYEGLFTLGSGYLHVRGSLEEHLSNAPQNVEYTRRPADVTSERFPEAKAKWGTYVPGIFGGHPLLGREMVNLPFFLGLVPIVDGEKLDDENGVIEEYRRELSLDSATLRRALRWRTHAGTVVHVTFERFVSGTRPQMCLQRMTLRAERDTRVVVQAGLDADVRTNGYDHFTAVELSPANANGIDCHVRTDGGDEVRLLTRLSAPAASWRYEPTPRTATLIAELSISADRELVVEKRTAVVTSRDRQPVEPGRLLADAERRSFQELHAEHADQWRRRWESCDVVIEGDERSQLAIRASLYHLLRCHVTGDARVAIDPKGCSGDAYWGRYFWDTEMFLLPFYLYTDPARARTLADFRVNTLDGARANAARYGYPAARYAWESDDQGRECCPNRIYADNEVHVTADIVYGLAPYARAVSDPEYLPGPAAQLVVETARYWMKRLDQRPGEAHPSLLGVMGPDEYTPTSDNNTYTNRMVAFALQLASEVGRDGGATNEERAAFARAAAAVPIPRAADGELVLQCEGFDRLADPRFDELWRDRRNTFASQVPPEHLHRSRCLKQADALMLMMLFPDEFSDAEVRRAWDYYLPLTTHDSSLSAGVHAIVAARLGLMDEAWSFWRSASGLDLDVERRSAAEGVHVANAAALWQVAVFGFGGMRTALQADVLTLRPRLPAAWSRLAFPIVWHGCPVYVDVTRGGVTVSNRGPHLLEVRVHDEARQIAPQQQATW